LTGGSTPSNPTDPISERNTLSEVSVKYFALPAPPTWLVVFLVGLGDIPHYKPAALCVPNDAGFSVKYLVFFLAAHVQWQ
jgi:hypothetical protein